MIEQRIICDRCKGPIDYDESWARIRYRIDVNEDPCTVDSTIDLCPECYDNLKAFFDNSKEEEND